MSRFSSRSVSITMRSENDKIVVPIKVLLSNGML